MSEIPAVRRERERQVQAANYIRWAHRDYLAHGYWWFEDAPLSLVTGLPKPAPIPTDEERTP